MKRIIILNVLCLLLTVMLNSISDDTSFETIAFVLPLQDVKVVIDPGHGGLDNGAIVGNVNEDELNLEVSLHLKAELEAAGATVYMTRYDDHDMTNRDYLYSKDDDMYLRVNKIDEFQADYLISIHMNASVSSSAWGSQVFYYQNSELGKILASNIHESMKLVTNTKKQISGSSFRVLRATKTTGVLIECGFITNSNERGQLVNSTHQIKLAKSIVEGLKNFHKSDIKSID